MKKIIEKAMILLILIGSFLLTNIFINTRNKKDTIMKKIIENKTKYIESSMDATILGKNIIPGKKGIEVDIQKSYKRMKQYGSFSDSQMVLKEVKPSISIDKNYIKYIIKGNHKKRMISLVFPVYKENDLSKIIEIVNSQKVKATFFLDGSYLENNQSIIRTNSNHQFEILSYKNSYHSSFLETSLMYLENITKKEPKYCYTKNDNTSLLDFCKKRKMHTIKPTIYINKKLFSEVKHNLTNALIISLEINTSIEKELLPTIEWIQNKGYEIVTLDKLLTE